MKVPYVLNPLEREIVATIVAGGRRPKGTHASRAINRLFDADVFTDIDPADNRHAIGGIYLTEAGRVAHATPDPPRITDVERRTLECFAERGPKLEAALRLWTKPGRAVIRIKRVIADLAARSMLVTPEIASGTRVLAWELAAIEVTMLGRLALKRRHR